MKEQKINERQKKFLLVLPLLAIPFLTMMFWALGGGKNARANAKLSAKGLNMELPGARLKADSTENKLSFYQKAEKDSIKLKQAMKDDPYYHASIGDSQDTAKRFDSGINGKSGQLTGQPFQSSSLTNSSANLSLNEQRVNQKLAELNRQLKQPPTQAQTTAPDAFADYHPDKDLSGLQPTLQKMNTAATPDPEMDQLDGMLDKIMVIQNPGLEKQKMKEVSEKNKGKVYPVTTSPKENIVSALDNSSQNAPRFSDQQNGFYSLDNIAAVPDTQNAIEAVIHQTQTLVAGATVKLRLANDIYVNGTLIPRNNFVFGVASLNGERLSIKISSIRYRHSIYPVNLSVFDIDGAEGIYIPGAITRDVAKESADQSIQNLGITTMDPSLGAQAASAGIAAAKSLFTKKVRLVKVTVKAGYEVLLRDDKQKQ